MVLYFTLICNQYTPGYDDELPEVETGISVGNKVETNVARKEIINKRNLFNISSSFSSSKSSEEEQKNVTEEPNVVDCANTAVVCDWKQRSTKATQATINCVSVKEEPTIPKDVLYQTQK
eukprot:8554346-Ditylum_brightwellii.AAC.1